MPKPRQVGAWVAHQWALVRAYVLDPEHRIMWGIILLAAALRLGHLDLIQFGSEQARYLSSGLELVENLKFPLIGIRTAAGVAEPPLMSYILAVPLLFGRDPRIAAAFVASLNVVAVAGCYLLARRYWGVRVALIAAVLFAVNPWAVVLSPWP
jgi:4-amino-4-deoxy-L-arabinose transferase-like glycosyltransferase